MNNEACMGYIKLACRQLNMKDSEAKKLLQEIYRQFSGKTEAEAEQAYFDIQFMTDDEEFRAAHPDQFGTSEFGK